MKIQRLFKLFNVVENVSKTLKYNKIALLYNILKIQLNLIFWMEINKKIQNAKLKTHESDNLGGWIDKDTASLLYAIIKLAKPNVIVETGIGPGMSSSIILKALFENQKGKLYSIDLPGFDKKYYPQINKSANTHVPNGYSVGWLVNDKYSKYWEKLIGDSKVLLPALVENIERIDVFMHDSLHTDEHIKFEFSTINKSLHGDSVLLCDDVNEYWSTEFVRLAKRWKLKFYIYKDRLGIARYHEM